MAVTERQVTIVELAANPWYINELHLVARLMLAVLLGGLIGFEREQSHSAAGLRTHIMVCLGSCLLMLLSIYGFAEFVEEMNVRMDPARLAAAVITGIGFLGAGTILHTGRAITGLTTAASIWVVSAIGLAVGAGFYLAAAVSTVMVIFTLWLLSKMEQRFMKAKRERTFKLEAEDRPKLMAAIQHTLEGDAVLAGKLSMKSISESNEGALVIELKVRLLRRGSEVEIVERLRKLDGVLGVTME